MEREGVSSYMGWAAGQWSQPREKKCTGQKIKEQVATRNSTEENNKRSGLWVETKNEILW